VLSETIGAILREFNRGLTNWYVDLAQALEPTDKELLALQSDILRIFHSDSQLKTVYKKTRNATNDSPQIDRQYVNN